MNKQVRPGKRLNQLEQAVTVLCTLILVVLLSFLLYKYDNQYTKTCQQPSNGVLDLRKADFDDNIESYHLQKDWEFYPNVLLTPEDDFSAYSHKMYSLNNGSKELRETKGTYRLRILLPDVPMSYALKLPTTFSQYRFYVNEDLVQSIGDKDVKITYEELFKDQILTFWASGEVQLLLHYDDENGLYGGLSGLSAPPVFGRPLRVYNEAEYHQFFLITAVVLTILILILSVSVYCRSWQVSNLAMIFLCVSVLLYLAYPLLSGEMLVPIFPWYQLGMVSYFSCQAALHWTYSLYFEWEDRAARFVNWYSTAAIGVCAAILFISYWFSDEWSGALFYPTVRMLQWGAILCGAALTLRIVFSGIPSKLMGAASVTPWAFMLIDLISPDLSPVIFVRLPEMGIICFMYLSVFVEYMDVASAHQFRILYDQKIAHVNQLLKLEERHYTQLSSQLEDARRIRHDLRQHLRVISSLLEQGDAGAVFKYLEQYIQTVQPLLDKPVGFFQIPIVDALISYYWSAAQKRGAAFEVKGQLQELPQSVYVDFCSIVGNLLENAVDALDRQEEDEKKWIRVQCEIVQKKLMLEVSNSNSAPIEQEDDCFQSSKRDELGTGTLSVSIIARQYGGVASFSHEEGSFTARVLLPLHGIEKAPEPAMEA